MADQDDQDTPQPDVVAQLQITAEAVVIKKKDGDDG